MKKWFLLFALLLLGAFCVARVSAQTSALVRFSAEPWSCNARAHSDVYSNSTSNKPFYCDGTTWVDLTATGGASFPLLAPDGTQAAPSYSFTNSADTGIWSAGAQTIDITAGNSPLVQIAPNGWWIGQSSTVAATHATPASSIISAVGALGTDVAGGNIQIQSGSSTGTGAGGNINVQVTAGSDVSSSTPNSYQTAILITPANGRMNLGGLNVQVPTTAAWAGANRATGFTDGTGGAVSIFGGRGTGTGGGGQVAIGVAPQAGSTGTVQNTLQNVFLASGTNGTVVIGNSQYHNTAAIGSSSFIGVNRATTVTDGAGGAIIIAGGRGTGTGTGGGITFQIAPADSSSGTVQNALQTAANFSQTSMSIGAWNIEGSPGTATLAGINKATGQTDGTGGGLNIDAGRGTGSGAGGILTLRIAPPGTTGTTQNALQNAIVAAPSSGAVNIGAINFGGGGATGTSIWQGVNAATGTTDKAAGTVNINGGQSTGSGAEGNVVIRLAPPGTTGTTQNALVDVERWDTGTTPDPQMRTITMTANNGATWVRGSNSELLTLSTSGVTTNTSTSLLPANSVIEAVVIRVTTTITGGGVTAFSVGDSTTAARFSASAGGLTAGSTRVGLQHQHGSVSTDATGPVQVTATTVRITCDATPTAGAIRIVVFYRQFTVPTS